MPLISPLMPVPQINNTNNNTTDNEKKLCPCAVATRSYSLAVLQFYAKDVNGTLTTLETRDPLMTRVIGQRQELSFYDVKRANKAYCSSQLVFLHSLLLLTIRGWGL